MMCFLFLFWVSVSLLSLCYACNVFLLRGRQKMTHSRERQWNSITSVKPQAFSSFSIQPLLLLEQQHQPHYSDTCLSRQKNLQSLTRIVTEAACHRYMSSFSLCNIKHGKYMVTIWSYKNWRNRCNHGLSSQYPQLTLDVRWVCVVFSQFVWISEICFLLSDWYGP